MKGWILQTHVALSLATAGASAPAPLELQHASKPGDSESWPAVLGALAPVPRGGAPSSRKSPPLSSSAARVAQGADHTSYSFSYDDRDSWEYTPRALTTHSYSYAPTSPLQASYTSDFESYLSDSDVSGDGLWQTGVSYYAWSRTYDSTPSYGTGPTSAHGGNYYMVCETSGDEDYFDLQTTEIADTITALSFYYHMYSYYSDSYDADVGNLYVQESDDAGSWTTIWTKRGNQGDSWQSATVTVSGTKYVRFKYDSPYILGTYYSYLGDAALDDVTIKTRLWTPSPTPLCEPCLCPSAAPTTASNSIGHPFRHPSPRLPLQPHLASTCSQCM